jgi:hypothetical protein
MIVKCHCVKSASNCLNHGTSHCIQCRNNKDRFQNASYDEDYNVGHGDPDYFKEKFRPNKNDFEM